MKTPSGHFNHLHTPSYSFYTPTPFPSLEQRLFPPRRPQSLENTLPALLVSIVWVWYVVVVVVVPVHTVAAVASHAVWSRERWLEGGWGKRVFPRRMPSWSLGQTVGVPLVGSLFWALVYGSPRGMDGREESTDLQQNGGAGVRNRRGKQNGNAEGKDFIDQAAQATLLIISTTDPLSVAPPPAPYSPHEGIPPNLLRGQLSGILFNVHPTPVPAFWQWKSVASAVSHGKVISVKPGNDLSGIGSGPALSPNERMILFFVGGGYHSGHAPQGPLSWTVCRQTSLRVLGGEFS